MRTLLATLCFLALSAVELRATLTVKNYKAAMASKEASAVSTIRSYIAGLGEGMNWANVATESQTKLIFCPPEKLALAIENYVDIIDRQIEAQSSHLTQAQLDDTLIGYLLIVGLRETFPCKGK